MDYCEGESLDQILSKNIYVITTERNKKGLKDKDTICTIFVQILLGLEHIHANNLIHRDIKPENIIVDKDNNVKILDIGCGFNLEANSKETDDHQIGTLHYMAPELIERQKYDNKVDVWSAGALLYELCTGIDPFSDNEV